jgi:hypothetical protein
LESLGGGLYGELSHLYGVLAHGGEIDEREVGERAVVEPDD